MNGAGRAVAKVSGEHNTSSSSLDLNGGGGRVAPPYDSSSFVLATRSSRHISFSFFFLVEIWHINVDFSIYLADFWSMLLM